MSSFSDNIRPIDELFNEYLESYIDKDEYYGFFKSVCDKFDSKIKTNPFGNYWENAPHRKVLHVFERIKFTYLIEKDVNNDIKRSSLYYPAITYHLLTCFDLLGQPASWTDFDGWLSSKKKRDEREQIVEQIEWKDPIEFAIQLNLKYKSIYGVKSSFFNFIKNILPYKDKLELFKHLKISIYDEAYYPQKISNGNEKFKESYLYKIRNNYTHKVFSEEPHIDNLASEKETWLSRYNYKKGKKTFYIYSDIQFYDALRKSTLIGLVEFIKSIRI
jgi:hypothetical protein